MGSAKNEMIEAEERGYIHSYKYVCANCFGDKFIKSYIRVNGKTQKCSFCKNLNGQPSVRNCLPLDDVMPLIMNAVNREYLPAYGNAIYDSEDKKYFEKVFDPWDFVAEELNQYMECDNSELILELENIMKFEDRCSADLWRKKQEEYDMEEWEHYCELVKKSKLSAEQIISESDRNRATENIKAIRKCLDKIYKYVMDMNMITTIGTDGAIYRVANHIALDYATQYETSAIPASLVGTAPPLSTNDNRMSEQGDMMFYGAFRIEVAASEVGKKEGNPFTIGEFRLNKKQKVLDLSCLKDIEKGSIFNEKDTAKRSKWYFLYSFMSDISMPKDEKEKYYKPTQVFTKYIQRKTNLAGIIYPSSKFGLSREYGTIGSEKCIVLFVSNRNCIEKGDVIDKRKLQLIMESNPLQIDDL